MWRRRRLPKPGRRHHPMWEGRYSAPGAGQSGFNGVFINGAITDSPNFGTCQKNLFGIKSQSLDLFGHTFLPECSNCGHCRKYQHSERLAKQKIKVSVLASSLEPKLKHVHCGTYEGFINDAQRLCDHNGPREVQTKPRQVCFYVFAPSTTCSIHQRPEGYQIQVPPPPRRRVIKSRSPSSLTHTCFHCNMLDTRWKLMFRGNRAFQT